MYLHLVFMSNFQLATLRGTILELSIPSGAKTDTNKGIPPRDVVEYIGQGEFTTSCLKLAKSDKKVHCTCKCVHVGTRCSCTCTYSCMFITWF